MSLMRRKSTLPNLPSLFDSFFEDDDAFGRYFASRDLTPAVNVIENDNQYEIDLAAPGLEKDDFEISLHDGQLLVAAEKKVESEDKKKNFMRREFSYSSFRRAFSLPDNITAEDVKASYNKGILKIVLSKTAPQIQPAAKKISIQ